MRHMIPSFEFRRRAREAMKPVLSVLLLVTLIAMLPSLISQTITLIAGSDPSAVMTELYTKERITAMMSDTAKQSMPDFWYLAALIAINLSVMNLLPFPALDGGRVIFVLYELIFRKPVNQKFESYVSMAGFVLLLALMFFVVCNDILRLIPH